MKNWEHQKSAKRSLQRSIFRSGRHHEIRSARFLAAALSLANRMFYLLSFSSAGKSIEES
ncbi:MAG: hypothetical protein MK105_03205 [Crocinitomicaceae bacterium]|nr:hypothetical protein [Crocinitomicaceae bacterium]